MKKGAYGMKKFGVLEERDQKKDSSSPQEWRKVDINGVKIVESDDQYL